LDTDTNISRDAITGLKSKAYFLISLEQTLRELDLPVPEGAAPKDCGIIAVYIPAAVPEALSGVARIVNDEADYATHYKAKDDDMVAGIFSQTAPLGQKTEELRAKIRHAGVQRFGVAYLMLKTDTLSEQALDRVAQDAYDDMVTHPPAP